MLNRLLALGRIVITTAVVLVALIALRFLWQRYEIDPWTRDGRKCSRAGRASLHIPQLDMPMVGTPDSS